jgi:hypothetical protein
MWLFEPVSSESFLNASPDAAVNVLPDAKRTKERAICASGKNSEDKHYEETACCNGTGINILQRGRDELEKKQYISIFCGYKRLEIDENQENTEKQDSGEDYPERP